MESYALHLRRAESNEAFPASSSHDRPAPRVLPPPPPGPPAYASPSNSIQDLRLLPALARLNDGSPTLRPSSRRPTANRWTPPDTTSPKPNEIEVALASFYVEREREQLRLQQRSAAHEVRPLFEQRYQRLMEVQQLQQRDTDFMLQRQRQLQAQQDQPRLAQAYGHAVVDAPVNFGMGAQCYQAPQGHLPLSLQVSTDQMERSTSYSQPASFLKMEQGHLHGGSPPAQPHAFNNTRHGGGPWQSPTAPVEPDFSDRAAAASLLSLTRKRRAEGELMRMPANEMAHPDMTKATFDGVKDDRSAGNDVGNGNSNDINDSNDSNDSGHGNRKKPACRVPGCRKLDKGRGLCKMHGGGNRCRWEDCESASRGSSGYCIRHGGGPRCNVFGCTKSARTVGGFCKTHGGGRKCNASGCSKTARGEGEYCADHMNERAMLMARRKLAEHLIVGSPPMAELSMSHSRSHPVSPLTDNSTQYSSRSSSSSSINGKASTHTLATDLHMDPFPSSGPVPYAPHMYNTGALHA